MRNFKKIALSLLIVGLAIGIQSFKNAENQEQNKLNPFYYGLNEAGTEYFRLPGTSVPDCEPETIAPCYIEYSVDPNVSSFLNTPEDIPSGGLPSETIGWVDTTP